MQWEGQHKLFKSIRGAVMQCLNRLTTWRFSSPHQSYLPRCVQSAFCVPWFTLYWPWVIIDCQCFGCESIPQEVTIPDFCHGVCCHFALLLANECTTHIGRQVDAPYHSALSAFYWRCLRTQTWMALYWRTINRFSKLHILSGVRASGLFWLTSVT